MRKSDKDTDGRGATPAAVPPATLGGSQGLDRRQFLRIAGLGFGFAVVAACDPRTATTTTMAAATTTTVPAATTTVPATTTPTGTLTIAMTGDVSSIDPHIQQSIGLRGPVQSYMDTLLWYDEQSRVAPWLAESFEVLDPTTWEFRLHEGVEFHNGEPLTAEAVKFSVERFVDPQTQNPTAGALADLEEVVVVDDLTVRMITRVPFPGLQYVLTDLNVAPPQAMREMGDRYFDEPFGTGPYRFVEWVPGERTVVEAVTDPNHWTGGPWVERIVWRVIPDATVAATALRTGEVDLITNVPPAQRDRVSGDGLEMLSVQGSSFLFLILNSAEGRPTADPRVRRALNYAVDKEAIVQAIFQGDASLSPGPIGPANEGFDPSSPAPYPYDPDQARQLLAEAGYSDGFSLVIDTPGGRYPGDAEVAEAISGQFREVGVETDVNILEFGALVGRLEQKTSDAVILQDANPDILRIWRSLLHSGIQGLPWLGYSNPEVDEVLDRASQETDSQARIALVGEALELLVEDAPWVFLHSPNDAYAITERVRGWQPRKIGLVYVHGVSVAE